MKARTRRVVVTGIGCVSSIGTGVESFTEGIKNGRSGISEIRSFDSSDFSSHLGGEVHDFVPESIVCTIDPGDWGRTAQIAAAAARLAAQDSGIELTEELRLATGAIIGTTNGEAPTVDTLTGHWLDHGPGLMDAGLVSQLPAGNIAAAVSVELGLHGETMTIPTACSAANYAIGSAGDKIVSGEADVMFAGGADSVNRFTHAGFLSLGAIADGVGRPFDRNRTGIVTAEGGAVLMLEELEHATSRGAHIYAELLGYGLSCDAHHIVHPDADSIADCIRKAHAHSGIDAGSVDYISAHGTGTPTNDVTEVTATRSVFGDAHPPMSSIKSMLGHTMGAASGFGAIACCKAIEDSFLPPTINLTEVDPELGPGIDFVAGKARNADVKVAQNHGFAFGGNNAITIFGAVTDRPVAAAAGESV
ncbi:beta-ketoacyl-[acyl-carrier-protein] synthase family protein [Streptomyces sp. CBMA156]|uniref:beta-ketoacyl-[acyl-carrier-protein] synthase family protein n=1 Tax=Streptomyces sp. CBMA156 TaxID=1930280 RepID=UPI001661DC68|nr:beta-ketoacyl-[acyl-carrier-protein] synthase family protein [Streptomyces sp. CBMA156]MBD0670552.1 3-oxoacyl-ACP synthase [Streptomyces sp. CBMA156]MBD0676470.1 3-oxoacyl-ACP synthase [Streptomyces sp. CBMA156]